MQILFFINKVINNLEYYMPTIVKKASCKFLRAQQNESDYTFFCFLDIFDVDQYRQRKTIKREKLIQLLQTFIFIKLHLMKLC